MAASYFRIRAAEARALARLGQDPHLQRLLLEVSRDLEAEASLIDAGLAADRRGRSRMLLSEPDCMLYFLSASDEPVCARLIDLSSGGACLVGHTLALPGTKVVLRLASGGPCATGQIVRLDGDPPAETHDAETQIAVRFDDDEANQEQVDNILCQLALQVNGAASTAARPGRNGSDRKASSPLNFDDIGRSSSAPSAS